MELKLKHHLNEAIAEDVMPKEERWEIMNKKIALN